MSVVSKKNENLEAEVSGVSGVHSMFLPHMPSGLQVILKTISVIVEYMTTIRLSSKVFLRLK